MLSLVIPALFIKISGYISFSSSEDVNSFIESLLPKSNLKAAPSRPRDLIFFKILSTLDSEVPVPTIKYSLLKDSRIALPIPLEAPVINTFFFDTA